MNRSITKLIQRAVKLEGGTHEINIAQAREFTRCLAVAMAEKGLVGSRDWGRYCVGSYSDFEAECLRKARRAKKKGKAKGMARA